MHHRPPLAYTYPQRLPCLVALPLTRSLHLPPHITPLLTPTKRLLVENTAQHKQLWIGVVLKALEDLDPPFMSLPRRKQLWIGVVLKVLEDFDPPFISLPRRKQLWIGMVLKALEDLDPPFISLPRRKQLWISVVLKVLKDLDPPSRVLHIPPAA
jgi:hypothetical protein